MIKKLFLNFVKVVCLIPVSFFVEGSWIKNISKGKKLFLEILTNRDLYIKINNHSNYIISHVIFKFFKFALLLQKNNSFYNALKSIYLEQERINNFITFILNNNRDISKKFVQLSNNNDIDNFDIKLIAFYLPQFYPFPLNDKWFGKGFTEWTNVTKAFPHYTGHYQPQIPIDTGFYSLTDTKIMERQIELAKIHGIYGFCFHYYWFSGKRLMEKPIFNWLKHKELNFKFCLNWANENWTKLWDGGNNEIGYRQTLENNDAEKFFLDILPFFKDQRYIKINEKPLFIIYRPSIFEKNIFCEFIMSLRRQAKTHNFPDLFIVFTNRCDFCDNVNDWGGDAICEFPPHGLIKNGILQKKCNFYVDPSFTGCILDGAEYINSKRYNISVDYKLFKGVFPSWDNTPRKAYSNATVIDGVTPELYKQWLKDCIFYTKKYHNKDEQFIFINAWNEWAEGAHLEPDSKYGYAYLQATRNALLESKSCTHKTSI